MGHQIKTWNSLLKALKVKRALFIIFISFFVYSRNETKRKKTVVIYMINIDLGLIKK